MFGAQVLTQIRTWLKRPGVSLHRLQYLFLNTKHKSVKRSSIEFMDDNNPTCRESDLIMPPQTFRDWRNKNQSHDSCHPRKTSPPSSSFLLPLTSPCFHVRVSSSTRAGLSHEAWKLYARAVRLDRNIRRSPVMLDRLSRIPDYEARIAWQWRMNVAGAKSWGIVLRFEKVVYLL